MGLSRNNHYIPQLYLSRWANNGRIYVYRTIVSHEKVPIWSESSIVHTASIENLYVSIRNDIESDGFERFLANEIESPVKESLDKICNDEKTKSEDWSRISKYVLAQFVRTPRFYYWVREFGINALPEQLDILCHKLEMMKNIPTEGRIITEESSYLPIGVKISNDKSSDDTTLIEISTIAGKGLWLFAMKHTLDKSSPVNTFFHNLKWSVISAPENMLWSCSDNPVVICSIVDGVISISSIKNGIIGKDKAVLFPVSPQKVLIGMQRRMYDWHIKANERLAYEIEKCIVLNAMLYIYSKSKDEIVPQIRPRCVDEEEYKRLNQELSSWYNSYKSIEGPLLKGNE